MNAPRSRRLSGSSTLALVHDPARRVFALATLFAALISLASAALAEPVRRPPTEGGGCASIGPGTFPVRVAWSAPTATRSCFFFSGPGELGRDDHLGATAQLEHRGSAMTLRFGALAFTGAVRADAVALERVSQHQFGGAWTVTERITGTIADESRGGRTCRVIRARYAYEECDGRTPCPGHCTIAAPLVIRR